MSKQDEIKELERKQKDIQKKLDELKNGKVPVPREASEIDWSSLIGTCVEAVRELDEEGYEDEDIRHYIYESAMEAVFGKDIWKWINSRA